MAAFSMPRWVGVVTAAESTGFLIPVAGFAISGTAGLSPGWAWLLMVACGAGEGALLGFGQAVALRGTSWQVPPARWVPATAVGGMLAWSLGMAPSSLVDLGADIDFGNPLTWFLFGAGAAVLLTSIPSAQYVVLRNRLPGAWKWIPVNAAAWTVGLVFTFLPGPFIDESTPAVAMAAAFVLAGVCMAAIVAVVTGLWWRSRPVLTERALRT
ncbi:hypothetical protein [Gordonia amicalis]|uniref:hypothetical protein n=1 Tax=Gordonia amicalis TaxID=89053 RepID=UPI0002A65D1E|nr:hypothetical protein [Gordonia amicalis]GAC52671.1 hypothetical protein GOAMI_14_00590 [Gordonia amicalis NBRC 100051 = JCM 11271]